MDALNEIIDIVSPVNKGKNESVQDALAPLLAEAIVEAAPQSGTVADDRRAA